MVLQKIAGFNGLTRLHWIAFLTIVIIYNSLGNTTPTQPDSSVFNALNGNESFDWDAYISVDHPSILTFHIKGLTNPLVAYV